MQKWTSSVKLDDLSSKRESKFSLIEMPEDFSPVRMEYNSTNSLYDRTIDERCSQFSLIETPMDLSAVRMEFKSNNSLHGVWSQSMKSMSDLSSQDEVTSSTLHEMKSSRVNDSLRTTYISDVGEDFVVVEVAICEKGEDQVSKLRVHCQSTVHDLETKIINKRKLDKSKWKLIGEIVDNEIILFDDKERIGSFYISSTYRRSLRAGKRVPLERFKLVSVERYEEIVNDDFDGKRKTAQERVIKKNTTIYVTPDITHGFLEKRGWKNKAWKQRYFVLCGHWFKYYLSEENFLDDLNSQKGKINMQKALQVRLPSGDGGLVSEETLSMRLKSNVGYPEDGEFHIVTRKRVWEFRVLPEKVDDQRDLIRWVRALQASLDYYSNDKTPNILKCLDAIIVETNAEQCSEEDSIVEKYEDVTSVLTDIDSRNLFLAYVRNTLPEISRLISGYYEYIVGEKYKDEKQSYAQKLLQKFTSIRVEEHLGHRSLTGNMQRKYSHRPFTVQRMHSIIEEILRTRTMKALLQDFLYSAEFKLSIWNHGSKIYANGEYNERAKWPTNIKQHLQELENERKDRAARSLTEYHRAMKSSTSLLLEREDCYVG